MTDIDRTTLAQAITTGWKLNGTLSADLTERIAAEYDRLATTPADHFTMTQPELLAALNSILEYDAIDNALLSLQIVAHVRQHR